MREEVYRPTFGFDVERNVWQINGADIDADRVIQLAAMIQAERENRIIRRGFSRFNKITAAVSAATGVTMEAMIEQNRHFRPTLARHLAVYLCRIKTSEPLCNIGEYFERHHATIIYSIRKIEDLIDVKDREIMIYLRDIEAILNQTNENDD